MALAMTILIGFVGGASASLAWSVEKFGHRLLFAAASGLAGAIVAGILSAQIGWDHLTYEAGWLARVL